MVRITADKHGITFFRYDLHETFKMFEYIRDQFIFCKQLDIVTFPAVTKIRPGIKYKFLIF
ncbi:hypothetical protein BA768_17140 [Chryseobacterium sp. CBo1]|nr:hypothetical protein BA768_17140 [Chryseobacterium sp. CBo1]